MIGQICVNIVLSGLIYMLIGLSFSIIYSSLRIFHMAHAIAIALSAYLVYTVSIIWGMPLWVSIPLSISVVVLLVLGIYEWIYLPLRYKCLASWQMMIASLGVYVILQNVVSMIWGDNTLSLRTWEVKAGHEFWGAYITIVQIITIVACLFLLVVIWLFMEKTNIGKQIKAVSTNDEMSAILGLNKNRVKLWSVTLGTALAACAGILIAADTDMTPTMGFNWLLYGVVAMIIGGMGKTRYLFLGALLLAVAQHLAAYYLDSKWMNATAYIILIAFLFFRPTGFSGKILKKANI